MRKKEKLRYAPYLAEAIGTFALVFAGPGAIAVNAASDGAITNVGIGLSFGLIIMAMVFALGHVSGCHINPAVTIAFRIIGRIDNQRMLGYIAAQLAGAALAGLTVVAIIGQEGNAGASIPTINGVESAFASEVVLTFFLVLVIMAVATDHRAEGSFAAIAVGGYVAFAATGWGAVAGASMNPARSLGPALAANAWDWHWVYWLAPIAGGVLAVIVYEILREPTTPEVHDSHTEGGGNGHAKITRRAAARRRDPSRK